MSLDSLVKDLAEFSRNFAFPRTGLSAEGIAQTAAESSWLKPIIKGKGGALGLYECWTAAAVPKMVKSCRYVINQEQFDILARRTCMDLLRFWREGQPATGRRLSLGAAFSIVDLLFMSINESDLCRSGQIQGFLHAPIGKATLAPLRFCVDELVDEDFTVEIPLRAGTGFIVTEDQYLLVQKAILALSGMARVAPLTYAYYCSGLRPAGTGV
jgi:hypothetical protein